MSTLKIRQSSIRKAFIAVLIMVLLVYLSCKSSRKTITLIHTNDIHGIFKPFKIKIQDSERLIGGMEAVSHYMNEIRATEQNVLLIDVGDLMTGTLASEIEYKGVPGGAMIEFLNRLQYDIWCLGNHDFDKGQDNALKLAELANFPLVMANIIYKKNRKLLPVQPFQILKVSGLKIGFIAVMEENFLIEVQKEKTEGLDVIPVISTLKSYVPELDKKTDLIVVLAHGCFEGGVEIAQNVPGVDVILVAAEDGKFEEINGVLVKSTKGHLRTLGYIKAEVEKDQIAQYEEKLVWLWVDKDLKPSAEVASLVKEVNEAIGEEYAKVIGTAKADLIMKYYHKKAVQVETALGNWVTDVMRWKTGTQIGLQNSGGIRADIKAGPVTKDDIFNVAPFHNKLFIFNLRGQQIKDLLEYDVERDWDRMQISGLKYRYYPKEAKPYGKRVSFIEINGEVLVKEGEILLPEKIYSVVSNDYLVGHAQEKYFGFAVDNPKNTGLVLDIVLMEWLEKHKALDYKIEGRIVKIME